MEKKIWFLLLALLVQTCRSELIESLTTLHKELDSLKTALERSVNNGIECSFLIYYIKDEGTSSIKKEIKAFKRKFSQKVQHLITTEKDAKDLKKDDVAFYFCNEKNIEAIIKEINQRNFTKNAFIILLTPTSKTIDLKDYVKSSNFKMGENLIHFKVTENKIKESFNVNSWNQLLKSLQKVCEK